MEPNDVPGISKRKHIARRAKLPLASGKASVFALIGCLVLTAALIPVTVRLPVWIEVEIVLAAWWLIWSVALARLLFRGVRDVVDHSWPGPRNWLGKNNKSSSGRSDSWDFDGCSGFFDEAAVIIVAVIVLFFALWLAVEIVIPIVALLLYAAVRGMLLAATRDSHHCEGKLVRTIVWGVLWASTFAAPLAGIVWLVHFAVRG